MNHNEIINAVKDVYYICYSMVKDEETAKDLTSDTFVTAFSKIMQLNREETFRACLSSIANHTCLDYLKRKKIIEFVQGMINTMN